MSTKETTPPKFPFRVLRWFCKPWYVEAIEGDLTELFFRDQRESPGRAKRQLYMSVVRFIRWRYLKDFEDFQPKSTIGMFKTYFKVSIRSISKNKIQATLNIFGLAVAVSSCLLIFIHVKHQLVFDRHIPGLENIYRVTLNGTGPYTPARLVKQMRADYPEIVSGTRVAGPLESVVELDGRYLRQDGGLLADSTFFDVFPATFVQGGAKNALTGPRDIVLTKSIADKFFPNANAVGKIIVSDNEDYTITAVVADPPATSSIPYKYLVSIPRAFWATEGWWTGNNFFSYLKLDPKADVAQLEAKFPDFVERYIGPELLGFYSQYSSLEEYFADGNNHLFTLIPYADIHLHHPRLSLGTPADYESLVIFSGVAIFILLIACVNYINMSTARSSLRAKEIGMRKVMGSERKLIVQQFLVESFLITFVAFVIGLVLAIVLLPYFNQVSEGHYQLSEIVNWGNAGWFTLILITTGLLAGGYPALYLSSFMPIAALKGEVVRGGSRKLRSGLVVFQFAISLILVTGTYMVYQQVSLMSNRPLGLDASQVFVIQDASKVTDKFEVFRQKLLAHPGILEAGITNSYPSSFLADWNYSTKGEDAIKISPYNIFASSEIQEVWGLKLKAGRFFDPNMVTDTATIVVNEYLVKTLGWEEPLGQELSRGPNETYRVIGVVENFVTGSAKRGDAEVLFRCVNRDRLAEEGGNFLMVKLTGNVIESLGHIEATWDEFLPGYPMDGKFLDDSFQRLYEGERRFGLLFSGFSILATVIACIGLFTLSSFILEHKRKEIALRKVLGAQVSQVFVNISGYFGKLMLVSALIAIPLAFYLGSAWLEDYVLRIDLGLMVFALPMLILAIVSLLTISYQTYHTATSNPVDALKEE